MDCRGRGRIAAAADRLALDVVLPCKNKEKGGSARALPVAAPMPKSVSLFERRENSSGLVLANIFFAYLSPLGWLCIYNVYYP